MNKSLKNAVAGILTVLLAANSIFFGFAQKAQAGTADCVSSVASAIGMSKIADIIGVPTGSTAGAVTSGETTGLLVQRCIIQPLVIIMVRSLLANFTASTVNWINSGFQGSPLYVTNLQGFLANAADQAAGSFIEGLGPIGSILCSPFDLQLRLSLGLQYSSGSGGNYQYIGCRLSDIQNNVNRAFTGGTFGKNGWDNWLQISATPQNNPYGAYLKAVDSIDASIAGTQFSLTKQLEFGKGFLSQVDPNTGKITTPGSVIESQLSNTLGIELQRVGLAQDLDAIIGALANQMINQVMGGVGGLAGASDSRSADSGGQSAVDRGLQQTVDTIIANSKQAQALPDGLIMNISTGTLNPTGGTNAPTPTTFCAQFKLNTYGTANNPPSPTSPVYVKVGGTGTATLTSKTGGATTYWTLADYNNVALFCQNVDKTSAISTDTTNFNNKLGGETGGSGSPTIPDYPLAINQEASQSGTYRNLTANYAVNGDKTGYTDDYSGTRFQFAAISQKTASSLWWQVKLNKPSKISKVRIYKATEFTSANSLGTFLLKIYDAAGNNVYASAAITPTATTPIPLVIDLSGTDIIGQTVRIERTDTGSGYSNYLYLAEVEVMGRALTDSEIATGQVSASQPAADTIVTAPVDTTGGGGNTTGGTGGSNTTGGTATTPTLTAGQSTDQTNYRLALTGTGNQLKARLKLEKSGGGGVGLSSVFNSLVVTEDGARGKITNIIDTAQANASGNKVLPITVVFDSGPNNNGFSISANNPLNITIAGSIATPVKALGLYRLTIEILNSSGVVIADQKTDFTIQ